MSKPDWREAARRCRCNSPAAKKQKEDELVNKTAAELQLFLNSLEGQLAVELLKASGRHIILAEERDGPRGTVYFLDGEGMRKSHEAMGLWVAHANPTNIPAPQVLPLEAREAVEAVMRDQQPLDGLIARICRDLDSIASEAPSP